MKVELEYFDGTDWQVRDVEFDPEEDFKIGVEDIDKEMIGLSSKLHFYGDLSTELRAQASRRKADIENVYNAKAIKIRSSAREKKTDARVKEETYNSKEYKQAFYRYIEADRLSRKLEGWFRSLSKVADLLIAMCYKQNNELKRLGHDL